MKNRSRNTKLYLVSIICVVICIVLDQYTKLLAVTHLKDAPIPIIDGVFELHYLENRGAAFGMLQNQQWFFLVVGIILLFLVTILYVRIPNTKRLLPLRICMVFITAGAIGNMIDRIRLNYVVDFLYFELINFPIFNVADIYVTVATFAIVLFILFFYKEEEIDELFLQISWKKKAKQE